MTHDYSVNALRMIVERDGSPIALSHRELELVLYMALKGGVCSREELLSAIWPDRACEDANVLRVYVNRVRARMGADAIATCDGGWRLNAGIVSDVERLESLVRDARSSATISASLRQQLRALVSLPQPQAPAWEWFAPHARRIEDLRHQTLMLLGHDSLTRAKHAEARWYAERAIENDPCDEPARELLILTFLAEGSRAAALRAYRAYRDLLMNELGVAPSVDLHELVCA